jgi:hypothetical protein
MVVECDDLLGVARSPAGVLPTDGPSEVKTSTPNIENVNPVAACGCAGGGHRRLALSNSRSLYGFHKCWREKLKRLRFENLAM